MKNIFTPSIIGRTLKPLTVFVLVNVVFRTQCDSRDVIRDFAKVMQAVPNFSTAMLDAGKSMKLIQETVADVLKVGPPFVTLISSIAENEIQPDSEEMKMLDEISQVLDDTLMGMGRHVDHIKNELGAFESHQDLETYYEKIHVRLPSFRFPIRVYKDSKEDKETRLSAKRDYLENCHWGQGESIVDLINFIAEKHSGCQALTADMAKQYIEGKQLLNLFQQLMSAHLDAARAHARHHHHNRASSTHTKADKREIMPDSIEVSHALKQLLNFRKNETRILENIMKIPAETVEELRHEVSEELKRAGCDINISNLGELLASGSMAIKKIGAHCRLDQPIVKINSLLKKIDSDFDSRACLPLRIALANDFRSNPIHGVINVAAFDALQLATYGEYCVDFKSDWSDTYKMRKKEEISQRIEWITVKSKRFVDSLEHNAVWPWIIGHTAVQTAQLFKSKVDKPTYFQELAKQIRIEADSRSPDRFHFHQVLVFEGDYDGNLVTWIHHTQTGNDECWWTLTTSEEAKNGERNLKPCLLLNNMHVHPGYNLLGEKISILVTFFRENDSDIGDRAKTGNDWFNSNEAKIRSIV